MACQMRDNEAIGCRHTTKSDNQIKLLLMLALTLLTSAEVKDRKGLDVVQLLDNLRLTMGLNVNTLQRRMALEQVGNVLADRYGAPI